MYFFAHRRAGPWSAENKLSKYGKIATEELINLEKRYPALKIDKYIVMPNHIHAIIAISNQTAGASPCPTLSDIICAFKSITTHKCHLLNQQQKIWQTSFHDHIIRNENDYKKIWEYIDTNAQKWREDCFLFILLIKPINKGTEYRENNIDL